MVLCAFVAVGCIGTLAWLHFEQVRVDKALQNAVTIPVEHVEPTVDTQPVVQTPPVEETPPIKEHPEFNMPTTPKEGTVKFAPDPVPVEVPIDFEYLWETNTDIYAWLDITGTKQEYPVLQNSEDNDYYLHRDIYHKYTTAGALYTQFVYNDKEFDDACTIIYGHDMANGSMFGKLEPFTKGLDLDDEDDEKNYFTIYTPTKILKYRIASAGVFSNKSILYYYDFDKEDEFNAFFDDFTNFSYGSRNISETITPQYGDKLVILLTCHKRNNNYRYITIGVLVEEQAGKLAEKDS